MAIEIRELVIRASVHKSFELQGQEMVTYSDLRRLKKEIMKECTERIRKSLEDRMSPY